MGKVDELKAKNENLFERNTILLNENERLKKENADLRDNYDLFKASAIPEIERLQKENEELKHNKKTVVHLAGCLEEKMKERIEELEQQVEQMKSDVIECFGSEYNVLVAKLLDKWEIKEND